MIQLGYQAPLPSAPTGVAQYAQALLKALQPHFDIKDDADLNLYQIGNNPLHWPIYKRAIEKPGVVLLHDAVLHHLLLGQLSREAYIDEFVYNYGEWFRQTAERLWLRRSTSAADPLYFERPMLRRLCEHSLRVIVHNRAAKRQVLAHVPDAIVEVLPHLYQAPRDHFYKEIDDYREQVLQVPRDKCVFAVLGHLRESKRLNAVLDASEALRRQGLPIHLLVQGKFVGEDLERAFTPRLKHYRGYLSEDEWWMQAHAIDVAINLRWPLAGESSGIATRLMGIGRPVIMTRSEETEDIPEVAAIKIDPGLQEREQLERYMAWLALNVEARRSIGRHAAIHTNQFHRVDQVAATLAGMLN